MKTRDITIVAVMAALLCVAGPLTVSIGPIPLSLATFVVYMAGAVLGAKRGTLAVAVYLLLGLVGLPVFSGFTGGLQKLIGVTGGYLVGYLPCALITGLAVVPDSPEVGPCWRLPAFMALQNTHASGSTFPKDFATNIGGTNDLLGVLRGLKSVTGNLVNFTVAANKEIGGLVCNFVALATHPLLHHTTLHNIWKSATVATVVLELGNAKESGICHLEPVLRLHNTKVV